MFLLRRAPTNTKKDWTVIGRKIEGDCGQKEKIIEVYRKRESQRAPTEKEPSPREDESRERVTILVLKNYL